MALLEQRNVTSPEIEARVRELIDKAMQLEVVAVDADDVERDRKVQQAAAQLKAWMRDWRTTAAVVITRRDYLISLGMASRRTSNGAEEVDEDEGEGAMVEAGELPPAPLEEGGTVVEA